MITLTEKEILSNWEKLRGIITDTFEGERLENLNKMYDYFEERMVLAPASGKEHFHYAMVGGYVAHVLHVVDLGQIPCHYFAIFCHSDGQTCKMHLQVLQPLVR